MPKCQAGNPQPTTPWDRGATLVIALLLLLACLALPRDIWPPDEPRYIQVAREMVESGSWLVPHLNGQVYAEKPPLFFWILALCSMVFGSWHRLVMSLPSVGAAIGCLWATRWFGTLSGRPRSGVLASWILAGSLPFLFIAQLVRMDMLLVLCVTLALAGIFRLVAVDAPPSRVVAAVVYVSLAAGTLTKGPVAVALPALATVVWIAHARNWPALRRLHLTWGVPLYLVLVLAWAAPAAAEAGPAYVWHVLAEQSVGRVSGSLRGSHPKAWFFYLTAFPWMALPWLPFFLASAVPRWRAGDTPLERRAVRLWWAWWMTTFVFFSSASGKLEIYLLPLFPAMALLTAGFWARVLLSREKRRGPVPESPSC